MRYCVYLHLVRRTDNGQHSSNVMTHIITLSNQAAVDRVEAVVKEGTHGWDDVLKKKDVLEYNAKFD